MMKSHSLLSLTLAFGLGLVVAVPLPRSLAEEIDDAEEREELTAEAVRSFLKEHLPEALDVLEFVKREEDVDDYKAALERAEEFVIEYHEILDEDGPKEAQSFLRAERLEIQIERLGIQWHETRSKRAREKIQRELETRVAELFDHELAVSQRELRVLRNEVASIEQEIVDLETNRAAYIAREISEILELEEDEDEDEGEEE